MYPPSPPSPPPHRRRLAESSPGDTDAYRWRVRLPPPNRHAWLRDNVVPVPSLDIHLTDDDDDDKQDDETNSSADETNSSAPLPHTAATASSSSSSSDWVLINPMIPSTPTSSSRFLAGDSAMEPASGFYAARQRAREAQRQALDTQRETLRAAERTISLLRQQIHLHDERARLSYASLLPPLSLPALTPPTTTTLPLPITPPSGYSPAYLLPTLSPNRLSPLTTPNRSSFERSLSFRIAALEAEIDRERLAAGLLPSQPLYRIAPATPLSRRTLQSFQPSPQRDNEPIVRTAEEGESEESDGIRITTTTTTTIGTDPTLSHMTSLSTASSYSSWLLYSSTLESNERICQVEEWNRLEKNWEQQLETGQMDEYGNTMTNRCDERGARTNRTLIQTTRPQVPTTSQSSAVPPDELVMTSSLTNQYERDLGVKWVDGLGLQLVTNRSWQQSNWPPECAR